MDYLRAKLVWMNGVTAFAKGGNLLRDTKDRS